MSECQTWRGATLAAVIVMTVVTPRVQAGQACHERPPTQSDIVQGMTLAQRTAERLDASGAELVILARAGQNLSKYHLQWSHLGFAYRDTTPQGRPVWRVLHKLNQCGTGQAQLYRQGLGEFFMDQPTRYEAAFVVPVPEVQARVLSVLRDGEHLAQWHTAPYSMVSYAWSQRYQQSNQWALETFAGAMDAGADNRAKSQAWLQLRGYTPSTLTIDPLTRLGGRLTRANIAFDDHPNDKRFSDRIDTVTVDSVFSWLERSAQAGPVQVVALP